MSGCDDDNALNAQLMLIIFDGILLGLSGQLVDVDDSLSSGGRDAVEDIDEDGHGDMPEAKELLQVGVISVPTI